MPVELTKAEWAEFGCAVSGRLAYRETGCWEWSGHRDRAGYGKANYRANDGRHYLERTHRVAWAAIHGPIPKGMRICHRCDNPPCCNPAHLFIGTGVDNAMDCIAKGRARRAVGERGGSAILTTEMVRAIRLEHAGGVNSVVLAEKYGTCRTNVRLIVHRRTWKHV